MNDYGPPLPMRVDVSVPVRHAASFREGSALGLLCLSHLSIHLTSFLPPRVSIFLFLSPFFPLYRLYLSLSMWPLPGGTEWTHGYY